MTQPLGRQEPHHAPLLPHPQTRRLQPRTPDLQAEALYDVDSIVADPGAYTKEELATLHGQIVSNLEQAWELLGGSEDQLNGMMMQISGILPKQYKARK